MGVADVPLDMPATPLAIGPTLVAIGPTLVAIGPTLIVAVVAVVAGLAAVDRELPLWQAVNPPVTAANTSRFTQYPYRFIAMSPCFRHQAKH